MPTRPSQPQRLVRSDGEWIQERLLEALTAWADEVGRPPRPYRVGARHYIRDGHHRVSVARELGAVSIEAEVVGLVRR